MSIKRRSIKEEKLDSPELDEPTAKVKKKKRVKIVNGIISATHIEFEGRDYVDVQKVDGCTYRMSEDDFDLLMKK